jgi:hypothetical protein
MSHVIAGQYVGREVFRATAVRKLNALANKIDASPRMVLAELSEELDKAKRAALAAEKRTAKAITEIWIATGEHPAYPADYDAVASDSFRDSLIQSAWNQARQVERTGGYAEIDRDSVANSLRLFTASAER